MDDAHERAFELLLFRAAMTKNRACCCSAYDDQSHRIVLFGVNSVRSANIAVMAGLTWQQYPSRHHLLVTEQQPIASVAFKAEFWSMQNDCRRTPFGFFLDPAADRFKAGQRKPNKAKAKKANAKEKREDTP